MPPVRTRFAPSPTGYMHIGGMRTALFNWLFARRHGGTFILRIDDTDEQRNQETALGPILRAFRWLGLNWDEGVEVGGPYEPYFQSQRKALYQAAADQLLVSGHAYQDFSTPEEIKADRDAADKAKRPYVNIRRSLDLTSSERADLAAAGKPWVLRLLVPRGRTIKLNDLVRGEVEWDTNLLVDPVIVRGNGVPLYNFATVVDDDQMQISHVIRAEEHLSNTPIQMLIYEALGHELPQFAHIPYVAAPGTKEKLSKRKIEQYRKNPAFKKLFERGDEVFPQLGLTGSAALDPVMVEYYERIGYLPAGVLNALGRLGWSLDDKTEILSLAAMVENFSLERVVKAPAGLDPDKLFAYQSHWMKELPLPDKVAGCLPFLTQSGLLPDPATPEQRDLVERIVVALGDRLKIFADILDTVYFFRDEYAVDQKAFEKRVRKPGIPEKLTEFAAKLEALPDFTPAALETALHDFATASGVAQGDMIHALRLATTGTSVGPGVYDCLALLGRARTLARIHKAVA